MLVYSPEEGEMRVDYSSIDSIKHYLKILHPAMIAVEPQSGKVKAWVGDLNYKYFQYDQVEAPRQVGSVLNRSYTVQLYIRGPVWTLITKMNRKPIRNMTTGPHAIRTTITRDITP